MCLFYHENNLENQFIISYQHHIMTFSNPFGDYRWIVILQAPIGCNRVPRYKVKDTCQFYTTGLFGYGSSVVFIKNTLFLKREWMMDFRTVLEFYANMKFIEK